ncbi:hypothetical protein N7539_005486 [Penicillium diatomitis]|uniref:Transcription factor hoxa13 n=1 Tax=Penicillium diatomitis TaxID=2819901 RepID=A0A9W9X6Z8_9EURO|nr:uncharacterized protein N7539_005486 [Penicillium diatomitis]KAJ5485498.1 hypothetical protein N7539_005486 [Penicillium diatomitis]
MAAQENGHASAASSDTSKGGLIRNSARKAKPRQKGPIRWSLGLVVRLCIWYTLLTPFLRCPSRLDELSETSPKVCKPYLVARAHVEPYLSPYYNAYAVPYVNQVQPYVTILNERVYTPVSNAAKLGYEAYGAPALQQAREIGEVQWKQQVTPRLEAVQSQAHQLYMAQIDPHIQGVASVVSPYYRQVDGLAKAVYWNQLVPLYTHSQPYIGKTYSTSQEILATHVMPGARYTWSSLVYFANSSLWPHVTGLYSEQVEPQLVKIGQRLASYREGKRLRAVMDEMDSTSSERASSTPVTTAKIEPRTSSTVTTRPTEQSQAAKPTIPAEEQTKQARVRIDSDLQRWQEKFAAAADKGIEDLEERIEEIVSALVESSAKGHGRSLSMALEAVSTEKTAVIKQKIIDLAGSLPREDVPEQEEEAHDKLIDDIRASAVVVRDRAHALRQWSLSFDEELSRRVSAAINSTLDVLDSIRDLGLQEIGTRWAWMDDVTYKDWAKYHALKAQLDDWRDEIRRIGMNHQSVVVAQSLGAAVLDSGMRVAEEAANELIRLKDVGKWKIAARDVSDNFDSRAESPPSWPKPIVTTDRDSQASAGEEDKGESAASYEESSSSASEGQTPGETSSSSTTYNEYEHGVESEDVPVAVASVDASEHSIEPIVEEYQHITKSAFGVAAASLNMKQEPILDEEERGIFDDLAETAEDVYHDARSAFADSTAQAKVLYEIAKSQAMAQMSHSSSATAHAEILNSIESAYSRAVRYASKEFDSRLGVVWATPTPTGPLAHISSVASSRLSEGLSFASDQLAQHTKPASSSAGSQPFVLDAQRRYYEAVGLAHEHYTAFMSSASDAVYGTPTPAPTPWNYKGVLADADSKYQEASSLASASLAAVVGSASSMISAADDGKAQSLVEDASSRYRAALSAASSSLSLVSASASSAVYGTTPGVMASLSSQASVNWETLVSKASEQVYGTPMPYYQSMMEEHLPRFDTIQAVLSEVLVGQQPSFTESVISRIRVAFETPYPAKAVSAASSYASEAYETASSVANAFITDVPSVEDVVQQANEQLQSAVEAASVAIYGTPKGRYEQATEAVAEAYSSASAQISGAVYGKEPTYIDIAKSNIEQIQSRASAAIYGEEPGAVESATLRLADAVESAQAQLASLASSMSSVASSATFAYVTDVPSVEDIMHQVNNQLHSAVDAASVGIYGTPKGRLEQAVDAASETYSSASAEISGAVFGTDPSYINGAKDNIEQIRSKASLAFYGEEPGAMEHATSRLAAAVESAQSRLAGLATEATSGASVAMETAASQANQVTRTIRASVSSLAKDEL